MLWLRIEFGKRRVVETDNKVTWKFKDETDHGLVKKKKICMIDIGDWNWMFLVQMNQLWLMLNINPFNVNSMLLLLLLLFYKISS